MNITIRPYPSVRLCANYNTWVMFSFAHAGTIDLEEMHVLLIERAAFTEASPIIASSIVRWTLTCRSAWPGTR